MNFLSLSQTATFNRYLDYVEIAVSGNLYKIHIVDLFHGIDFSEYPEFRGADGVDGVDGINGINGTNGTDGRDGIDGINGADLVNVVDNGDGSFDLTWSGGSRTIWTIPGMDGADGINGTDGADGTNGTNGSNGTNGVDGLGWIWGTNPTGTVYATYGTLCFDYTTGNIFSNVGTNMWGLIGNIMGPPGTNGTNGADGHDGMAGMNGFNGSDGLPGTNGTNGSRWFEHSGSPIAAVDPTGAGDYCLDIGTGDVWVSTAVGAYSWTYLMNIMGPAGADGTNGSDGSNGLNGIDGSNGVDGANGNVWQRGYGNPNDLGSYATYMNDMYLDGSTGDVYYSSVSGTGGWIFLCNIHGASGADGANGADGTNGMDGANGMDGTNGTNGSDGMPGADAPYITSGSVNVTDLQFNMSNGSYFLIDGSSFIQTGEPYWSTPNDNGDKTAALPGVSSIDVLMAGEGFTAAYPNTAALISALAARYFALEHAVHNRQFPLYA